MKSTSAFFHTGNWYLFDLGWDIGPVLSLDTDLEAEKRGGIVASLCQSGQADAATSGAGVRTACLLPLPISLYLDT